MNETMEKAINDIGMKTNVYNKIKIMNQISEYCSCYTFVDNQHIAILDNKNI